MRTSQIEAFVPLGDPTQAATRERVGAWAQQLPSGMTVPGERLRGGSWGSEWPDPTGKAETGPTASGRGVQG